jgi:hypothetical protein
MAGLLVVYKFFKPDLPSGRKGMFGKGLGRGGCLGGIGGGTNFAKSTKGTKIITKAVV